MTHRPAPLARFFAAAPSAALVEVAAAKGSTPREAGAWMLVAPARTFGTIGGGQLEFMAIDKARQMLDRRSSAPPVERIEKRATLDIPLGPEIGQCCGGRVELSVRLIDEALKAELIENAAIEEARLPHVYLFGGGHVGHALAAAFALLPLRVDRCRDARRRAGRHARRA